MFTPAKLGDKIESVLQYKGQTVWSVNPHASVYEAIELMSNRDVGALVVTSGNEVIGVMSERDYARKIILLGKSSKDTQVREIMTSPAVTVTPDHTVNECMHAMTHNRVRHLPVIAGERLVGVVSIGDLVNWIISAQEETIQQLHRYIAGSYPA
jgi:CBS domain-containing protein